MLFSLLFALAASPVPELRLSVTNLAAAKGKLFVGIYDSPEAFLQADKVVWKTIVSVDNTGSIDVHALGLPPGVYAISCFHDLNGNGKLDTNFLGIPIEPYGFSNNVRPRFRAPSWDESKFELGAGKNSISIRLEKW